MFARTHSPLPFATAAISFAIGAAITWALAEAVQRMRASPGPISDDIVLERVRTRVAHLVTHPDAVEVTVENGVVRLAGDVTAEERDQLLTQLLWLPGVVRLRNALGTG
jgi:osmotically-inducible protein OsmY